MRVITLSVVVLFLWAGCSHAATIREGREGEPTLDTETAPEVQDVKPIEAPAELVASELRKSPENVAEEAPETVVAEQTAEAAAAEVVPVPQLRIAEPAAVAEEPVAVVVPEKEIVSEVRADSVVTLVEPEVAVRTAEPEQDDVALRNGPVEEEIVSELKSTPVQAVEEVAVPATVTVEEPAKAEPEEAVAVKSAPIEAQEEPEKIQSQVVEEPVVIPAEENAINAKNVATDEAVVADEAPVEPIVPVAEEVVPAVKAVPVEQPVVVAEESVVAAEAEVNPEVQPVNGVERQNAVTEGEQHKPTFFEQATQVLTNNPITQFIANNPLTNAIRGGTTAAPGTSEQDTPASSTTARPGIFAQLFNRDGGSTTSAPVADPAQSTTNAPGFIQTAFSNIQNAPSNIINNLQNIFSGNRETTAAPTSAAPEAAKPEVEADAPTSNAIDQAKKKRLDEEVVSP